MNLSLYMDHHVRSAVVAGLRRRGVDVLTTHDDGASEKGDKWLLQRATELGRIIYTNDDDFLEIAAQWQKEERPFSGVVYAHQENVTDGQVIKDLELIAKASDAEYMRNRVEYLPL